MCVATTVASGRRGDRRYSSSAKPLMSLPMQAPSAKAARATDGAPGVNTYGHVESTDEFGNDRHDALELFGFVDLVARTGLHSPDVQRSAPSATSRSARLKRSSRSNVAAGS
jgi:hypothetical protein